MCDSSIYSKLQACAAGREFIAAFQQQDIKIVYFLLIKLSFFAEPVVVVKMIQIFLTMSRKPKKSWNLILLEFNIIFLFCIEDKTVFNNNQENCAIMIEKIVQKKIY